MEVGLALIFQAKATRFWAEISQTLLQDTKLEAFPVFLLLVVLKGNEFHPWDAAEKSFPYWPDTVSLNLDDAKGIYGQESEYQNIRTLKKCTTNQKLHSL